MDEGDADDLRHSAALQHPSMQDLAHQAVRDHVEQTSRSDVLDAVMEAELPRYAQPLERLGQ